MFDIATLQRLLPAKVKNWLKPHYRTLFPNRLHVVFWPTFRCNYRCSYCPVVTKFDYATIFPLKAERPASDWLDAFAKLPPALIYISGGEPFLYGGLTDFVNGVRKTKHTILGIVSNATVKTSVYDRIAEPVHLNLSFHREFTSDEKFLTKVDELRVRHHVNVNVVATPENLPVIEQIDRMFRDKRVTLHVDPFVSNEFKYSQEQAFLLSKYLAADRSVHVSKQLDFADYDDKQCSAGRNYINVMPNGDVYTCLGGAQYTLSPLQEGILARSPGGRPDIRGFAMGNLFDRTFRLLDGTITCKLPCTHACDLDAASIKRAARSAGHRQLPVITNG